MATDSFGVPDTILGAHSDDFYASVGRVVCLSSVLENKVLSLHQALVCGRQGDHTQLPIGSLIDKAVSAAGELDDPELVVALNCYLERVRCSVRLRNHLVHNLWPAQDNGTLFGWRPKRDKTIADGTASTTTTTLEDVRNEILELVELLVDWQPLYARASWAISTA